MRLLRVSIATVLIVPLAVPVSAHGPHRHGVKHDDALKVTENSGIYCVTELAPMFREAVALSIKAGISPAPRITQTQWPFGPAR
jgi:hypothetical protein